MKDNKRSFRAPLGFMIGICAIFIFCIGSFWTVMLESLPVWTPTQKMEIEATHTMESVPTVTLEVLVVPSFTPPPEWTSTPEVRSFPAVVDTQVSFSIPVTGASCIPNNPPQTGRVVEVVDGDSIKVQLDQDGQIHVVRYIGMDTPEDTSQIEQFGPEATAKNVELVSGRSVTLVRDVSETDRYGRLLRYVFADGVFVNYELVSLGYANTASHPPDVACLSVFQEAERGASASKLGLWAVPPALMAAPAEVSSGGNAPCGCGGPDLDCKDFQTHASAQACYEYCRNAGHGDIHRLDGNDNDGLACESLP